MSAMAAAPPPPRLDSVLSFGNALPSGGADAEAHHPVTDESDAALAFSDDAASDYDDDDDDAGFEFAFAPPLVSAPGNGGGATEDLAPADDIFAHGRILPAYPVFDRHLLLDRGGDDEAAPAPAPHHQQASTAPPSPDTYCAWAPRSAPGSPAREFPKSNSTGEARRSWRLRDLVSGAGGRSHSDGKEKFLFLQPTAAAASTKMAGSSSSSRQAAKPSAPAQKQSRKKGGGKASGAVTEMDMATAHKLFYGKQGGGALAGDKRRQQQQSYLPYRPAIVGFFTAAHAIGRSHHPY